MESLEDNSLLFRDVSYTEPAAWFQIAVGKNGAGQDGAGQYFAGFVCRH